MIWRDNILVFGMNTPPKAQNYTAMQMNTTLDDLIESFSLFDGWEDRYRFLIDLGQRLPPMDEALKTAHNIVPGCTSRVWMVTATATGEDGQPCFRFIADSDAKIVKGLIYILMVAYQGQAIKDVASVDIRQAFDDLGLSGHLSPSRRNGFFAMVDRITGAAALA